MLYARVYIHQSNVEISFGFKVYNANTFDFSKSFCQNFTLKY